MSTAAKATAGSRPEVLTCINIMRGLAALSVMALHTNGFFWRNDERIWEGGMGEVLDRSPIFVALEFTIAQAWIAVPLFLVISGFCIHLPYAGPAERELKVKPFASRRLVRLYPAYIITVLIGLAMAAARGGWGIGPATFENLLGQAVFWNFGFLPPQSEELFLVPPLWTLTVEVHLYLIYLLLLPLIRRYGAKRITIVTLVIGVLYYGAWQASLFAGQDWPGYLRPGRNAIARTGEWMLGVWLAESYVRGTLKDLTGMFARPGVCMGLGAGLIIGCAAVMVPIGFNFYMLSIPASLGFALIILGAIRREKGPTAETFGRGRFWRWANTMGNRAYSLYLIHVAVIAIVGEAAARALKIADKDAAGGSLQWLGVTFAAIVAVFIAMELLYRFVEIPSHKLARYVGKR